MQNEWIEDNMKLKQKITECRFGSELKLKLIDQRKKDETANVSQRKSAKELKMFTVPMR